MRIVGGRHRGRAIAAPPGRDTRPTADRARETLFNMLAHRWVDFDGLAVVDAFAGSGGLGLEALSRGAAPVFFIERHGPTAALIDQTLRSLGETNAATVVRADATRPPPAPRPCGLALLDPPYASGLAGPCLEALRRQGWLAPDALAVVEVAAKEPFEAPDGFAIEEERIVGAARFVFLRW